MAEGPDRFVADLRDKTTPRARRWPNAAWWAPLLHDLVLLEAGNETTALLVTGLDLAEPEPRITATAGDGTSAAVRVDPDIEAAALRERLQQNGLTVPEPALDRARLWMTEPAHASPLLIHAWALNEFTNSDAFPGRSWRERTTRIDLREICGGTSRIEVTVHLVPEDYCISFPVVLDDLNGDYSGIDYALTEAARRQSPAQLERIDDHHGTPPSVDPTCTRASNKASPPRLVGRQRSLALSMIHKTE